MHSLNLKRPLLVFLCFNPVLQYYHTILFLIWPIFNLNTSRSTNSLLILWKAGLNGVSLHQQFKVLLALKLLLVTLLGLKIELVIRTSNTPAYSTLPFLDNIPWIILITTTFSIVAIHIMVNLPSRM